VFLYDQSKTDDHQWIVCDGPVDTVWIENMNTVLDDNKILCLANSERIKLTPYVRMVFEVQDLAQASPASVSCCGMVYIDPDEIKWLPYVRSWLSKLDVTLPEGSHAYIENLFSTYLESAFVFVKTHCDYAIHQVCVHYYRLIPGNTILLQKPIVMRLIKTFLRFVNMKVHYRVTLKISGVQSDIGCNPSSC
jgi:hypothetical protein